MTTEPNTGRVAVIAGASSGIGEATARALAADGHRLALLARRAERVLAPFLDQLRDGGGDLVNISSVAGSRTRAPSAPPSSSTTSWPSPPRTSPT